MNWLSIASLLIEQIGRPALVLDDKGTVRLINQAMEATLGCSRFVAEGKPWESVFRTGPEQAVTREDWLERVLAGHLIRYRTALELGSQRSMYFDFEVRCVAGPADRAADGDGESQSEPRAIILIALACYPTDASRELQFGRQFEYEVRTSAADFGKLVRVSVNGQFIPVSGAPPCFELFYRAERPCGDCPVLRPNPDPWPRTVVRPRLVEEGAEPTFDVMNAEQAGDGVVRLGVFPVSRQTLRLVHKTRLDMLSQRAGLSERESQVLECLLLGRSIEEMASMLSVTRRTIKYHQSNVLSKLGAGSRLELLRILS